MLPNEIEGRDVGRRIREQRELKGYSLKDVAENVGVAISTIQRYENGEFRRYKFPIIMAIARVLQVNPLWLMGRSDEKSPLPAMGAPDTIEYVLEPSMPQQKSSPSQEDNELDPLDKRLMDFVSTLTVDQEEFLLAQLQTMIQLKKEIPPSQDS